MRENNTNSTPDHFSPITEQEVTDFKVQLDSMEAVVPQVNVETTRRRIEDYFAHHAIKTPEATGDASPEEVKGLGDLLAGIDKPDQLK